MQVLALTIASVLRSRVEDAGPDAPKHSERFRV